MGEPVKGTYRRFIPSRFLAADDLPPDQEFDLTITGATLEEVEDPASRGKKLVSLHFRETEKLLALNKTNARAIARITGTPVVEQWAGHKIRLRREMVRAFGEEVPAVRVVVPGRKRSGARGGSHG